MKKINIYLSIFLVFSFFSCKKNSSTNDKNVFLKTSKIKYAKGFDIVNENGTKKLIIKNAFQNSNQVFEYEIIKKNNYQNLKSNLKDIHVPIEEIVVTSTTHIPMVELFNEETSIVGFPFSQYVSSAKTRHLIDRGNIKEIGNTNDINTEILLDLQPEFVVGYAVSSANKTYNILEKAGIPVIYNADWLEETPLGRAEWIKFFGVLFDKERQADSIFNAIETDYLEAKKLALKADNKPTVLSGAIMSKDIWSLPAGESFVAKFLQDANVNYLWKETKGKGSLSLSFESVFDKGNLAELWIAPGYFSSKEQLLSSNKLYQKFESFQQNNIYTPSTKKGKTGGVIYYELASTRPDLVLKDLIKIAHPRLLPNYEMTFFEKMQ